VRNARHFEEERIACEAIGAEHPRRARECGVARDDIDIRAAPDARIILLERDTTGYRQS